MTLGGYYYNYPYNLTIQGTGTGVLGGLVNLADTTRAYGGWMGGTLIKKGSGTWTLNGANNLMQLLDIQAGTVNLGHPNNTLVDNANVTVEGGTLNLSTNWDKVGVVTLVSGAITGSGTLQGFRYDVQSGTITPALAGPVSALTKTTGGTVTIGGANTYLGDTWVQAGTLVSTNAIGGNVLVENGAALTAAGTIGGSLTVNSNGTLAVNATPSQSAALSVGSNLVMNGTLIVTMRGLSDYDAINVNGNATLTGNLVIQPVGNFKVPGGGAGLPIVTATGTVTGKFTTVTGNYVATFSGNQLLLSRRLPGFLFSVH